MTAPPVFPQNTPHAWNAVLSDHLPQASIQILQNTCIGIIGAGGIGSNVALMLARSGIGTLLLADGDTVALSNLNRQAYTHKHIGQAKVVALKAVLQSVRPDIHIKTFTQYISAQDTELFSSCDVILEAVDTPTTKRSLTEAFLLAGHHIVATSGMAGWGGEAMQVKHLGSRLHIVGDHGHEVDADKPAMAPRVIMAAALQADVVLSILLGKNA